MKIQYQSIILFFLIFPFLFAGCWNNAAPAKVTGTITLDGQPVRDATVTFVPDSGERLSQAMTDYYGKYELRFTAQLKGAVVGKHRVTIQTGSLEASAGSEAPTERETIPKKYNTESELTATLKSGNNVVDFELTSK